MKRFYYYQRNVHQICALDLPIVDHLETSDRLLKCMKIWRTSVAIEQNAHKTYPAW